MADKRIGQMIFHCEQLRARAGQRLFIRLGKMFGNAIEQMYAIIRSNMDEQTRDISALQAFAQLFQALDPDDADALLVELCEYCTVTEMPGQPKVPVRFNHHLDDSLETAWSVAYFVLETNFRSFLDVAARLGVAR